MSFWNSQSAYRKAQANASKIKAYQKRKEVQSSLSSSTAGSSVATGSRGNKNMADSERAESESITSDLTDHSSESSTKHGSFFSSIKKQTNRPKSKAPPAFLSVPSSATEVPKKSIPTNVSTSSSMTTSIQVEPKEAQAERTLQLINETISSQEARLTQLDGEIGTLLHNAKIEKSAGNDRTAVRLLKKRKLKQHEQQKLEQAIETMEAQVLSIESALENSKLLRVMQQGANTMKSLRDSDGGSVEQFDTTLAEIGETMDYAAEIQEILTQPVSNLVMDDDQLLEELEELERPQGGSSAASDSVMDINLPSVPNDSVEVKGGPVLAWD